MSLSGQNFGTKLEGSRFCFPESGYGTTNTVIRAYVFFHQIRASRIEYPYILKISSFGAYKFLPTTPFFANIISYKERVS